MARRKRAESVRRRELERAGLWQAPLVPTRVFAVPVYVPRPLARRVRREVYSYSFPSQRQRRRRTIRIALGLPKGRFVKVLARVRLPAVLPAVGSSYVSTDVRGSPRLTIHSARQVARLMALGELNRRRYSEDKSNRRKARNGQLDSPGSDAYGLVAHAVRRGASVHRIADAALVARAILRGK